jgi:hypothetical protein
LKPAAGIENDGRRRTLLNVECNFVSGAPDHLGCRHGGLTIISLRQRGKREQQT